MNYRAERINFYVPAVFIKGTVPQFSENTSYQPYSNAFDKQLFETRSVDFTSSLEARQSLISGGEIIAAANLLAQDERVPDTRFDRSLGYLINRDTRRGFFSVSLQQPLLRPSATKHDLNTREDELEIAAMTKREEEVELRQEVIDAYVGLLRLSVKREMYGDKLRAARLQADIDSAKYLDGILSEEEFLLSVSERLDAELAQFEVEAETEDQRRKLALLLDVDVTAELVLSEPVAGDHFSETEHREMISSWEETVPIRKAERQFRKSKRAAEFSASGHGLTGDLEASYSVGRGTVENDRFDASTGSNTIDSENINTSSWSISLNFSLPVWDGGAGRAEVEAARFEAEQYRLEYERARQTTRAEIINLVNETDVSHRRLQIIAKQVEIAENNLEIARLRHSNGEISEITLLESEVFLLETKDKYLEELNSYLSNRAKLEGTFLES
jgi:outer membrane protein TolC